MGECLIILTTDQRLGSCSLYVEAHGWILPQTRQQLPFIEFHLSVRVKSFFGHFYSKCALKKKISGQELTEFKYTFLGDKREVYK